MGVPRTVPSAPWFLGTRSRARVLPRLSWVGDGTHLWPVAQVMGASVPLIAHLTREEACRTDSSDQGRLPGTLGA